MYFKVIESPESDTPLTDEEGIHSLRPSVEANLGLVPYEVPPPSVHSADSDTDSESEHGGEIKLLEEEMYKKIEILRRQDLPCFIHLVGTEHGCPLSCREVQSMILHFKPEVVFLEFCLDRLSLLTPHSAKLPTMREIVNWWWDGNAHIVGLPFWWYLFQASEPIEVSSGAEFRALYELATECGAKVILGDRPTNVTLRRIWVKMSLWRKAKFLFHLLYISFFPTSTKTIDDMMLALDCRQFKGTLLNPENMIREIPTLMETLLHEKEQYMTSKLMQLSGEHMSVVAIVGKGHVQGIKKLWYQPSMWENLENYLEGGKRSISRVKMLVSCGIGAAGVAIIFCVCQPWQKQVNFSKLGFR